MSERPTAISDAEYLVSESFFEGFAEYTKPYFDALQSYIEGKYDDVLLADLTTPKIAALEMKIARSHLFWMISKKHIKTYTDARLVRRSEVRRYLERRELEKEAQKAKKASEA